jgi:membrane-bound lytic murein transglycosylase D
MSATAIPAITITLASGASEQRQYAFHQTFRIGRHPACALQLSDDVVSRQHAEVSWEGDRWWLADLQSANGVFMDGVRVHKAPLSGSGRFQLGSAGPMLAFQVETLEPQSPDSSTMPTEVLAAGPEAAPAADLDHYKSHYFGKDDGEDVGAHTMMVRRAFAEIQKRQRITYLTIIGVISLMLVATGAFALYKHRQVVKQRKLAADVFYTMRSLEIDLIKLRAEAEHLRSVQTNIQIDVVENQKEKLEQSYNRYVESLNVYRKGLSEKEKIILRMAHRFGECEINMPKGFADEVMGFIAKWQSGQRLANVIARAKRLGYIPRIVRAMAEQQLPPQFFYLAVQESNLNHRAVGPPTRFGIAKGMWQFIPSTAEKYGLRSGPLKDEPLTDPLDEREDFAKSTTAAARYIRDIYTTDAQASGLLVMASYNWGERRVVELIQSLPANPRERNFWQLITKYRDKIPDETYTYVFSIFAAAVIGENPRLFGFDFDNPLSLVNRPG